MCHYDLVKVGVMGERMSKKTSDLETFSLWHCTQLILVEISLPEYSPETSNVYLDKGKLTRSLQYTTDNPLKGKKKGSNF